MQTLLLLTTELATVVHLMMSLVLFYFSRRSVRYLALAWIMLLVGAMYGCALFYIATTPQIPPLGILHPVLLIYLVASSYLLSIYPLGICMPGYLQWGRMWGYATPALVLIFIYGVGAATGSNLAGIYELEDITENFLSGDVLLRLALLLLSGYYIMNIFLLPHRLVRNFSLPADLASFGIALGGVSIFFVALTVHFTVPMTIVYELLFTIANLFLCFRIMRPILASISLTPPVRPVASRPSEAEIIQSEQSDFNEANLRRFEAIEYVMQHEEPYRDLLFNRDRLCRLTGINRHLVLQSLRSQGYNDVHEYISRYRAACLRRLIEQGQVRALAHCDLAGFRTAKTAQASFALYEGIDLGDFLRQCAPHEEEAAE